MPHFPIVCDRPQLYRRRMDPRALPPISAQPPLFAMDALDAFASDQAAYQPDALKTASSPPQLVETPPPPAVQPALPAPTPRVTPLSLEEKQERQRMHVRRSYYKKRNYIRSLREQVASLEKEYAEALAAQPDAAAAVSTPPASSVSPSASAFSPTMASEFLVPDIHELGGSSPDVPASAEAVQIFMQLSSLRDSLRHENDELKKALIRYANFVRRVQQSIEDAQTEADEDPSPHVDTLDFFITRDECMAINLEAFEELKRFIESDECVSTGISLFGWRDKRRVVDGFVQFSVKKFYNDRSAYELSLATWEVLSTPSKLGALYSPSMSMDLRQIQRVDDDNVVYYRRIDRRGEPAGTISKSIFLISRFRTELGFVLLFRTCDSEARRRQRALLKEVAEGENETWHDVFSWILFEELGDHHEHAQFSFGGHVDTSAATPQFWMLEVLLLSLRWEASVVGPMFTLS